MSYLVSIIIVALLAVIINWFINKLSFWKFKGVNQQNNILLGQFLCAKYSFIEIYSQVYKKYQQERVVGLLVGSRPILLVRDPTLINNILTTDFNVFHSHGISTDPKNDFLSDNILFMDGKRWKIMRQKLSPTFTPDKLRKMSYLIIECNLKFEKYLDEQINADNYDVAEIVTNYTTSVITACALGVDSKTFTKEDSIFKTVGRDFFDINILKRILITVSFMFPWIENIIKPNIFKSKKHEFPIVFNQMLAMRQNSEPRQDFIDLCLDLKKSKIIRDEKLGYEMEVTDKLLAAQAFFFYLAGFDTTSTTMGFVLYELADNDVILQSVLIEIDCISRKHKSITFECLEEAVYLDKVINETLILYPPIGFIERVCGTDTYKFPDTNIVLNKGDKCVIPIFALQRDGKYYSEPDKFDPERYNIGKESSYVYLPFGGGPRTCLGLRMAKLQLKAGLLTILKNYVPVRKTAESLKFVPGFIALKPQNLNIYLTKR